MSIHHSAPHDPASFVHHTHRRPLETNVQSCKHPHRCSPSFARGITSGKGRFPAGEQQPHVWDVLGSELITFFRSDNTILIRFWKGIRIVRSNLFWLSDEQWKRIQPHLPTDVRGVERADDRRVISGIVHVLKSGCRWCDCPPEYGPPTTIYNRFVRWARRGIWENLVRGLARNGRSTDTQMIDSTHVKAHRSAAGGKGGRRSRLLAARVEGATRRFTHLQMLKGALSPSC